MSDWDQDRLRFMTEMRAGFQVSRPTAFVRITALETASAQQIMDELRVKDPDAAAKLGELVVVGEDGQITDESRDVLLAMIKEATS